VHGELQIKQAKMAGDQQLKAQKTAADLQRKDLLTAHGIQLKNFQASTNGATTIPEPSPAQKISESISYKDAPDDIKRQMEIQAGLMPSRMPTPIPSAVHP
jgi:hypothetical protein